MKRTFFDTEPSDLIALSDSQRNEVLFFATAHFLFFNFLATAQVAHFVLPQHTTHHRGKTKRATFCQRFIAISYEFKSENHKFAAVYER